MRFVRGAWLAALLAVVACSSGTAGSGSVMPPMQSTDVTSLGQPDHPIAGPQGSDPQFVVECRFSHAPSDDPMVHPGMKGASHLHVFFGNTTTDAYSTTESLVQQHSTTCDERRDTAAYWAPALTRGDAPILPVKSTAYYRAGVDVDPTTVQPFPKGLVMIAGSARALTAQPVSIVAWSCGTSSDRLAEPPECGVDRGLRLIVTFPDCWDGVHLDTPNHHSHIAYSHLGRCPNGYGVPIPQLQFAVEYPVHGSTEGLQLSSGGLLTGHADFMNGWDQATLDQEVRLCLHRKVVCGITSGRKSG
jgi:hypothetical protein